jgi:tetratricopeptide (TPR) repeat protein
VSDEHSHESNGNAPPGRKKPASRDEIVARVLDIYEDAASAEATSDDAQLRRLIQAIRNRRGRFGLLFAVCNEPSQRRRISAAVRESLPDTPSTELQLVGDEESLLDTLAGADGAPNPLIVYGVELLLPSGDAGRARRERTLRELQLRREQFRSLGRPLLLWMPEYAYALIGQQAVDFWSWQSGGFFFSGRQTPTRRGERASTSKLAEPAPDAPPAELVGRERQHAEVAEALRAGATVVLHGIAGAGKSDLALDTARRLRADFPDGQLLIALGEQPDAARSPADGLREAIRAFLPDSTLPDDLAALTALYRGVLGGRRALILLDDVPDAEAARPFLPPEGVALLITAREPLRLPGARNVAVDHLLPAEALALLAGLVPELADEDARAIVDLCAHLPLAIRVVAGLLRGEEQPARAAGPLVVTLRAARKRRLAEGHDATAAGLEAALQLSYNLLDRDAARVLRLLSLFPASFDAAAEHAVGRDAGGAALERLVARALVQTSGQRLSLHSLVRAFAAAQLQPAEREAAGDRHALHYARVLDIADDRYRQGHTALREGLALFDTEWPNIRAGQRWAAAHAESSAEAANLCISYPIRGRRLLELRRPPRERTAWIEDGLRAARQLGLRDAEATLLRLLGQELAARGQGREATLHYEQALAIARAQEDTRLAALLLGELSPLYREQGEYARATEAAEQALASFVDLDDQPGQRSALESLGLARRRQGQLDGALEALERSLALARTSGDRRGEAAALYSLGSTAQLRGNYGAALEHYRAALAIAESLGDQAAVARLHAGMGLALLRLGDSAAALAAYARAVELARSLGDRPLEGTLLASAGAALLAQGALDAALDVYHQALEIARSIGDRRAEATTLNSLGAVYRADGDRKHADELFRQALAIAEADGDHERAAVVLNNIGHSYRSAGDYPAAERSYRQALALARESGDARREAAMLHNLGQALLLQGDDDTALACFDQQRALAQAAGDRYGEAAALRGMAHVRRRQGAIDQALETAGASLALLEQLGHPEAAQLREELAKLQQIAEGL